MMKLCTQVTVSGLLYLLTCTPSSFAVEPPTIALVNVDRIFKTHRPFQEKLEPLKTEAKELEQTLQTRQAELETVGNQLRRAQQGTPESQRLQVQFVKLQNELQQFVNTERQSMQKKEAAAYLGFYRELDAEVNKYAKAHGLKLVLRQFETSLDENQPLPEILKALSRTILYEESLDITDEILKAMQAKSASAPKKGTER